MHAESVNSFKIDLTGFGLIKTLFMISEQKYTEPEAELPKCYFSVTLG